MPLRTCQQIIIKNVRTIDNRQFQKAGFTVPDRAKPAAIRTATRRYYVSSTNVSTGNECCAGFVKGWPSDLHWRDVRPSLGQLLGPLHVPREGHAYVYLVNLWSE
jgi:hypothetical protein